MQRLPLTYLRAGMKTFEEVVDAQGRVLCGKGVELTDAMIQKFRELGVSYVTVEGRPVNLPWEKSLEEELSLIEQRFAEVKDDFLLQVKEVLKAILSLKHTLGQKND